MLKKANVTAVIVTYNTSAQNLVNIVAIIPQVQHVVIIDNGSNTATLNGLRNIAKSHDTVENIFNDTNLGLATAQNIGIQRAINNLSDWVLLLDDDSLAESDMIDKMLIAHEDFIAQNQNSKSRNENTAITADTALAEIAIIAPDIKDCNVDQTQKYVISRGLFFKRVSFSDTCRIITPLAVIASGSLIKISVIKKIGNMRDDFFIDYIDTEFSLRAIAAGYNIIVVADAVLHHHLGDKREHKFCGRKIITSNHSPKRRYTIYRNRCIMWQKYIFKVPRYIIYDITAAIYDLFRIILFEQQKWMKLKYIAKGIFRVI